MKYLLVVVVICVLALAESVSHSELLHEEWNTFQAQHSKEYDDSEREFRFNIFLDNKLKIAKHNQRYERKEVPFKMSINKYSDLLNHEFVAKMNGFNRTSLKPQKLGAANKHKLEPVTFISPANVKLPGTVDWRTKGAVTPIKDQGHCGSCWAFSATGSLEGQHFRKDGVLVSLSEQNLVDCSTAYGNNGCNGGLMDNAFSYIKDNGGIDTERSYPYEARDDACHFNANNIGATDKGFVDIPEGDEIKMKQALATIGPISVAIDASHESFQFYSEGVYYEPECDSQQLDHGVLAVGYGTDDEGIDYWIVKNSWGTSWGAAGYVKMARNKDNHCGIATASSYPLV